MIQIFLNNKQFKISPTRGTKVQKQAQLIKTVHSVRTNSTAWKQLNKLNNNNNNNSCYGMYCRPPTWNHPAELVLTTHWAGTGFTQDTNLLYQWIMHSKNKRNTRCRYTHETRCTADNYKTIKSQHNKARTLKC